MVAVAARASCASSRTRRSRRRARSCPRRRSSPSSGSAAPTLLLRQRALGHDGAAGQARATRRRPGRSRGRPATAPSTRSPSAPDRRCRAPWLPPLSSRLLELLELRAHHLVHAERGNELAHDVVRQDFAFLHPATCGASSLSVHWRNIFCAIFCSSVKSSMGAP